MGGTAARHVGQSAQGGEHRHGGVALRQCEGDDQRDERSHHPHQLLAHAEAGKGPSLRRERDVSLRHGIEGGLGHGPAEPHHEGEQHLGQQRAPDGTAGRRGGDEPERAQEQLLLGHAAAKSAHQNEPDDGADAGAGQHQAVPPQADPVHAAQPEGEHEGHEPREAPHDAHGRQPEQHLGVGDRLELHQVLFSGHRLAGLAVLAGPGGVVGPEPLPPTPREHRQPGARHGGGHEHHGAEHEYAGRARHLVEDHGGEGRHEAGDRAEQREAGVQCGVARFLALFVRSGQRGHLGNERALGDDVELLAHEHQEGEGEEEQAVDVRRHEEAEHGLPDARRHHHEPAGASTSVDERTQER